MLHQIKFIETQDQQPTVQMAPNTQVLSYACCKGPGSQDTKRQPQGDWISWFQCRSHVSTSFNSQNSLWNRNPKIWVFKATYIGCVEFETFRLVLSYVPPPPIRPLSSLLIDLFHLSHQEGQGVGLCRCAHVCVKRWGWSVTSLEISTHLSLHMSPEKSLNATFSQSICDSVVLNLELSLDGRLFFMHSSKVSMSSWDQRSGDG